MHFFRTLAGIFETMFVCFHRDEKQFSTWRLPECTFKQGIKDGITPLRSRDNLRYPVLF